jgi:hypothetical protein
MSNSREVRPGSHQNTTHERDTAGGNSFVNKLRGLINKAQQERTHEIASEQASPASIIHYELKREVIHQRLKLHDEQKAGFFETVSVAWDALAVEAYSSAITKEDAYDTLYFTHKRALERHDPNADVISLSPEQTKFIDILADAANIPNRQKGRQYVPIPAKGRRSSYWSD